MKKSVVALMLACFTLSSCATVFRGSMIKRTVKVRAPKVGVIAGAQVYINDTLVGVTDEKGNFKHKINAPTRKGQELKLKVSKEGYFDWERTYNSRPSGGWIAADTILGLIFGFIPLIINVAVDGTTGKWNNYPGSMKVKLIPKSDSIQ